MLRVGYESNICGGSGPDPVNLNPDPLLRRLCVQSWNIAPFIKLLYLLLLLLTLLLAYNQKYSTTNNNWQTNR